jgi:AcrR family transcriptional regulator
MTADENNHSSVRDAAITQPEVHDRILDAAERLFRQHGYLKVTVKDVAEDLGMSPANVYRFYESKTALREALVSKLTGQVEGLCAKVLHGEGSAAERLASMIVEYHRLTLDRYLSAVNAHDMLDAAIRENWKVIDNHSEQMRKLLLELIEDGIRRGEFKVTDPDCAVRMVYTAIIPFIDPTQVALLFVNDKDFKQAREMSRFVVGALKSGCV